MSAVPVDALRTALERKGFDRLDGRGSTTRVVRRNDDRHDHVVLGMTARPWWRRWTGRTGTVEDVLVGVLWPIGEMAFSRPVPSAPTVPQQVHAATSFTGLVESPVADPATVAAVVDDWCRRLEDPAHALEVGAIGDPIRRLEFCVVTADRERGQAVAAAARAHVESMPPATRAKALERIELAEGRLPRA